MMWAKVLNGAQDLEGNHLANRGELLRVVESWHQTYERYAKVPRVEHYAVVIDAKGVTRSTVVGTDVVLVSPLGLLARASLHAGSSSTPQGL